MTLLLSGTDGLSDVDGSAATPAIRGTDANTGIFFPAADTIAFAEGGAEIARFDSSGNLGVGTASPTSKLDVNGALTATSVNSQNTFGFKNRLINGAMVIDQRNAGASVTPTNGQFSVDRWKYGSPAGSGVVSLQRVADAPAGFINSLKCTVTTASTPSSGDTYTILQPIEGSNIYDFNLGTASAQAFTISFWVKSSVTGTFSVAVRSTGGAQTFLKNYVVSSANTWEYKTVLISAPTSGTFATDTSSALFVNFSLGAGSSFISTESSWNSGAFSQTSGATNLIANSGATFYITGVQLEKGSTATSFDYRPYGTELALCQRYFCKAMTASGYANTTTSTAFSGSFPVTMRTSPTMGLTGVLAITDGAANFTQSSISVGTFLGTDTGFFITGATNFTGLTQYRPYLINYSVNVNLLTASAEL
jgi:hypothetical protein